ncbi:MAG: PAS domain S-box protein [Chloroflexota bacterium]
MANQANNRLPASDNAVLDAINKVFRAALTCETGEQLAQACLEVTEMLTGSQSGFICELNDAGRLDTLAFNEPGKKTLEGPAGEPVRPANDLSPRGMWGRVITEGEPVIINDPPAHCDWSGMPGRYEATTCFLGVPLRHGAGTVGMVGLTNKESGYTLDDRKAVETLSVPIVESLIRKRAEEALLVAERNFRNSLDNSPLGITITSTEGKMLYANQALLDIYGYRDVQELVALPPKKRYTPKSCAEHRERIEVRKLGRPVPSPYEASVIHKDGSVRHLMAYRKAVVWNGEVQFQTIYQDITEQKQNEEKIRHAAEEWRATFDSITDMISIHSRDCRIIRVNKAFAEALHTTPKDVVGKLCYEVIHGAKGPPPDCPHRMTLKTGNPMTAEFFEPSLEMYLQVSTSPMFDQNGGLIGSVHIARDITERKTMEKQLITTGRLATIGELASGVAHELNNPLTAIVGLSAILSSQDLPEDAKKDVSTIYREAQRTARIVKNLLTFARKHELERQPVDVNSAIQSVLELRTYEQKAQGITVNTLLGSGLPTIMADGFQLQQVFLNIIINAEFFMVQAHGKGVLTITTEQVGKYIRVSFADDGPGISQEHIGHVFDPFFTTKEVGKGTGLGLSICHGVVTAHGGRIYAESGTDGGATFVVEIPISGNNGKI